MDKRQRWIMIALCLAAFALRLGPLWANRFHPDEALYASWGLLIRTGRDVWLSQQSADKPPLLFYLLAVSFHYVWRSEVAARLPGLMAGTLSVPLIFQISNLKFKISNGVAAALMAFSPFAISLSPTAFLDPVMVMLALAACAAAVRKRAGLAGVLLGLSTATKLTGLLFLPLVVGFQTSDSRFQISGFRFQISDSRFQITRLKGPNLESEILNLEFWAALLGVLTLVVAWDRLKGGTPFWIQQAINYGGLRVVALAEVLPRLYAWLSLLPYFFGWPALIAIVGLMIVNFRFHILRLCSGQVSDFKLPISNLQPPISNLHLLLAFALFYFATHWLLTFQVWDRYLLGLVPVIALLAGQAVAPSSHNTRYASRITHHVSRFTFHVLLLLLLPSALIATRSGYPIGDEWDRYDGIERVADYLRAQPEGTVVYDHWLGWEFKYYLWDAQVYRAYFPTPDVLRDDLRIHGDATPRYVVIPADEPTRPVLEAIVQAGFRAAPVLTTTNRHDRLTFTVYRITPPGHE